MNIEYSPKFFRMYKKLSKDVKKLVEEKIEIFGKNPFDVRLKTHKLSGALRDYWSFWINQKYRITFVFWDSETARFHSVGDHDIYQ
ncbi:type II toxin-antitoxin system mRNA interferase toxin, RelE/StbE family [Patescibacteria group bacterium]|nr:type II toxin-antitoxin system mRNA interferase toxin, RelE/StbE family [Patescibacteria group bacterium]